MVKYLKKNLDQKNKYMTKKEKQKMKKIKKENEAIKNRIIKDIKNLFEQKKQILINQ